MKLRPLRGMARVRYATDMDVSRVQPLLNAARTFNLIDRHVDAKSILARI
jgi:hypothetical protein